MMARRLLPTLAAGVVAAMAAHGQDLAGYAEDVRAADGLLARGDYRGIVELLEPWAERMPERPEARHFLGLAQYRLRDFKTASLHLAAALEREQEGSAAWRQTVEVLGAAYYFNGRWNDAAPLLEMAVGWRPEDSDLLYTLAMTRLQLGQREQARAVFARIFGVDPAVPEANALGARLLRQEGREGDAEALVREAFAERPDMPGMAYYLGVAAFRRGDYGGAERLLRHELSRDPAHALAWRALGRALSALGSQDDAVEALKRAVWLDKGAAASYILLAGLYVDQDRLELAESTVQRAIEIAPSSYEAHFLQSRIYYKTGRADLARKQLAVAERLRNEGRTTNR